MAGVVIAVVGITARAAIKATAETLLANRVEGLLPVKDALLLTTEETPHVSRASLSRSGSGSGSPRAGQGKTLCGTTITLRNERLSV